MKLVLLLIFLLLIWYVNEYRNIISDKVLFEKQMSNIKFKNEQKILKLNNIKTFIITSNDKNTNNYYEISLKADKAWQMKNGDFITINNAGFLKSNDKNLTINANKALFLANKDRIDLTGKINLTENINNYKLLGETISFDLRNKKLLSNKAIKFENKKSNFTLEAIKGFEFDLQTEQGIFYEIKANIVPALVNINIQ